MTLPPRPERRASDPIHDQLSELIAGQERLRESHHDLRGHSNVVGLRTERIEREVAELTMVVRQALDAADGSPMGRALGLVAQENRRRIEALEKEQDEHGDYILALRTGLGLLKFLVGASVLGTVATTGALGRSFGWW